MISPGHKLLTIIFAVGISVSVTAAGPADVIIPDAELIRTVLGNATDIRAEQVTLTPAQREWIDNHFRYTQPEQTVTVWLSRDASGRVLAGLIKADVSYEGQTLTVAMGLSAEARVIRAAVTAAPASLRQPLEATIGIGYLKRYTMMSARQLGYLANVLNKEGQLTALVAEQLFESGAILSAIIDSAD